MTDHHDTAGATAKPRYFDDVLDAVENENESLKARLAEVERERDGIRDTLNAWFVRVRIPYVVSADGRWCAYGYPEAQRQPDWSLMEEVADNGAEDMLRYQRGWIEVDLPVPTDAPDITGRAIPEPRP